MTHPAAKKKKSALREIGPVEVTPVEAQPTMQGPTQVPSVAPGGVYTLPRVRELLQAAVAKAKDAGYATIALSFAELQLLIEK